MFEKTIESAVKIVAAENFKNKRVAEVFHQCFTDTLENTLEKLDDGTYFVQTGDIPAMWLRDSTLQMRPYLPFLPLDADLRELIKGISRRQIQYILYDPYANAFNKDPDIERWDDDLPPQAPYVWEQKYEIDSLCFPVQLAYQYWKYTEDDTIFDEDFHEALHTIIALFKVEQFHEQFSAYTFQRPGTDMLVRDGQGSPTGYTGMTWSGFRPSDDACEYHYLVPSNLLAAHTLKRISEICEEIYHDQHLQTAAEHLREEILLAVQNFGLADDEGETILAYEVDGLGNQLLMDDSNMPSLLSLPLVAGFDPDDELYQNTRKFVLSSTNPYYYSGKYLEGVGSPHTPKNHVWPIAVSVQGLTSTEKEDKLNKIEMLVNTDHGTGFMHESIHQDDPSQFTREWFSWANAMFCELVLDYVGVSVKYQ